MDTLVYCYDADELYLLGGATTTVRRYVVVPVVGDYITSWEEDQFIWEYWVVERRIFNYKGGGAIDLMLKKITYKDLYK